MTASTNSSFYEAAEQHGRQSTRLLLAEALVDGRPIRREVREALSLLLDSLAISDDDRWNPDVPVGGGADLAIANGWQAAAWQGSVVRFRDLLAEVRKNGVSAGSREEVTT